MMVESFNWPSAASEELLIGCGHKKKNTDGKADDWKQL
jgi:hypothetical protein